MALAVQTVGRCRDSSFPRSLVTWAWLHDCTSPLVPVQIDGLVDHFMRFQREERQLPVVWHQALLCFVQRWVLKLGNPSWSVSTRMLPQAVWNPVMRPQSLLCPSRRAHQRILYL